MQSFQEYHAVRQLADLCEATGDSPEAILNEFMGFLRRMFGGRQQQQPEQIPIPRPSGSLRGADDRGLGLYRGQDIERYQRGEGHATQILKGLQDGFQKVVAQVGQQFGAKAQPFFADLQQTVASFVNKTLYDRIKVKLKDDQGRVGLGDPNMMRQMHGGYGQASLNPARAALPQNAPKVSSRRGR